eukprot:gene22444-50487_t
MTLLAACGAAPTAATATPAVAPADACDPPDDAHGERGAACDEGGALDVLDKAEQTPLLEAFHVCPADQAARILRYGPTGCAAGCEEYVPVARRELGEITDAMLPPQTRERFVRELREDSAAAGAPPPTSLRWLDPSYLRRVRAE